MTEKDYENVFKANNKPRAHAEDYGLTNDDPLFLEMYEKAGPLKTIGHMALAELERLDGVSFQGTELEEELLFGFESVKASLIYTNEDYVDKITEGYIQYDMNSAYSYQLSHHRMPDRCIGVYNGVEEYLRYFPKNFDEEIIAVYQSKSGAVDFEPFDEPITEQMIYIYSTKEYGRNFVNKWLEIKKDPKYKKFAKFMMNIAIGAIHKYRRNLIARYVWYKQKKLMEELKGYVEDAGGTVLKIHTDSIGFILEDLSKDFWDYRMDNRSFLHSAFQVYDFKLEYNNKRIYLISAGQYQVEGCEPALSGISTRGGYIETDDGHRYLKTAFPCIEKGMVVRSYESDGIEYKELGRTISFV